MPTGAPASDFSHVQTVVGLYNQILVSVIGIGIGLGNAIGSALDMGSMMVSEAIGAALGMSACNVIPGLNLIIALTNIEENPLGVVIASL